MPRTLTRSAQLAQAGFISDEAIEHVNLLAKSYAIAITPDMAALIDASDMHDPIAKQFVPDLAELNRLAEERADPIDDAAFSPLPGLVHRYKDRVLLKVISACPVYCRFCFRREMVGPGGEAFLGENLDAAIDYIAARPEIFEVIMTGGDPFMLSPRRVDELTKRLAAIPHVTVLRWHTRVPIVDADRVTPAFVDALQSDGAVTWVAIHANHPREFTPKACKALKLLASNGISLVSQSVLLKGVNDHVDTLSALMRAFVANRVKPYYLHHPDLAPGTSHFRNSITQGQALMRELRMNISGLAQPMYVIDVPGGAIKAPIGSEYMREVSGDVQFLSSQEEWLDYKG
jgi:lysine 2,3-aminomutase